MASIDLRSFTEGTVLSIHNICYREKVKSGSLLCRRTSEREILTNINGIMKPGLNAIMECTSGDKSLLLDVLAARKDPSGLSGDILINGAPRPANFKCNSSFVVQDDILLDTLTVRENLHFSAALRLPTTVTKHEKDERIKKVIDELDLEEVADSKVESRKERIKTSIAMELITDPSILFLDEPTKGLDSSTANAVFLLLKKISEQGRTIIFSFHEPQNSIFKLFDSLTILASGRLMFHGPAQEALEYFASAGYHCEPHNNPLDFFQDILNGYSPAVVVNNEEVCEAHETEQLLTRQSSVIKGLAQFYAESRFYRETETELERLSGVENYRRSAFKEITYGTTFCHQVTWIIWRSFKNWLGHLQPWIVQIIIALILGLVIGFAFLRLKNGCTEIQNRAWSLYVLTVFQCVTSVLTREIFLMERNLFIHECISGYYRVSSYFFGKLFFDLLLRRFFPSFVFTLVLYFMLGTRENAASGRTLLVTIYFVFTLVFLGMSLNFGTMTSQLSWLQYFSIPRYGYMALQHNEFLEQNFCSGLNTTVGNCRPSSVICTGEEFLIIQGIDLSPWSLWKNLLSLAFMMIICLTITYLKLLFLNKHS
ncbi:broad substrate specificity ATP-binding cassette transporter ABCG2-like isoform X2 [Sciurus carolinensis]|uniref:broad substrate specificity ATP-binding cassette transporter ABCG2-like isoform X2 n=1 Tax=Sciurus carolinensis TaxID=30640 RepID=UPI001FB42C01|nr:broad substrate specificity ATP-binding cassette transporter ABCG2-like isoform X2 [Sciurus carolinensis]